MAALDGRGVAHYARRTGTSARVRSLEDAAAFVAGAGIAVMWRSRDLVLPSLWEAVAGSPDADWAVRGEDGRPVGFTDEFSWLWRWKDELPERRLACAGRHFGRFSVLIAPSLVASAYVLTGRRGDLDDFRGEELGALERELAEAVLELGPATGPELRLLLGTDDRKGVEKAVGTLQRRLVLTGAGAVEQDRGWRTIRLDLLARRWRARLRRLPDEETARRRLARAVVAGDDEVSAADVAAALGWRRTQATAVLTELEGAGVVAVRDVHEFRLWRRR